MLSKTTRKMMIGDIWRIGEHESWFSHMAGEGWSLQKIGTIFAYFERQEAQDIRYRIETSSNKNMSSVDKEMYRERGWKHVTRYGKFNVFLSPTELQAPELYTDPIKQSHTLIRLDKKIRIASILLSILLVASLAVGLIYGSYDNTPTLTFVEESVTINFLPFIIQIISVYYLVRASFSIRKLRKRLSEGREIDHNAPWRRLRTMNLISTPILLFMAVVFAVLPWMQIGMNKMETLPTESKGLPIVRLADIEQSSNLVREEFFHKENLDLNNRYSSKSSFFAPLQYQTNEQGIVPNQLWQEGGATYSPSLHTQVYKLNFPFVKENLIADLTQEYGLHIYEGELIELESDVFEILFIRQVDEFKEVFAAKGKGVIYVSYMGHAHIDTILEVVEDKLDFIEN